MWQSSAQRAVVCHTDQGRKQFGESCGRSFDVPFCERNEQSVLVQEVLIQRPH